MISKWTSQRRGAKLSLALAALLLWPAIALPTPARAEFVNVAEAAGVAVSGIRGAAWADYDADGCVDLLLTRRRGAILYRNACDGTGGFIDVTRDAGIPGPQNAWTAAWADYDGDGDLDVFIVAGTSAYGGGISNGGSPDALYRNEGDGTFTNVASRAGVADPASGTGASWADYDNDGDLDLFVANRWQTDAAPTINDRLYRNEGDGTFSNVARTAGIGGSNHRQSFMGAWLDYDLDGDQDLYVAIDFDDDVLYRNEGDGTFTIVNDEAGISGPEHGMGIAVGDLNGDGCLDLFSTNNTQADDEEHGPSVLYMNNCDGTFYNGSSAMGVLDRAVVEWGANFVDWDNDSDLDLAVTAGGMLSNGEPNVLYENRCEAGSPCVFYDVTDSQGVGDPGSAFGSAWADYDNDGDLDWFVANSRDLPSALFRNDGQVGRFLRIYLSGTESNTNGVGALVELTAGGRTQYDTIQAGLSFVSDEQQIAFFGLGLAKKIDRIRVFWPSGIVSEISGVRADQTIQIIEGHPTPIILQDAAEY